MLTSEQTKEIIEKYLNGESVLALSKEYQCGTSTIQSRLDGNNIPKISQAKRNNPDLIENYFETIDNKYKAYWIGWLLTDGCIYNENISISLQQRDKHILDLFQTDLGLYNHVIPFQQKYYQFNLGSKIMCQDLAQYGIVPNKTLTLKFPTNIPEQYETHLLRGMFEGDGGLTIGMATRFYKHRNKSYTKPYRELSFTGTYDMCEGFQNTLLKYVDMSPKNITHNHAIYRIRWHSAEEISKIYNVLYQDCDDHYLIRKYNLFQQILEGVY